MWKKRAYFKMCYASATWSFRGQLCTCALCLRIQMHLCILFSFDFSCTVNKRLDVPMSMHIIDWESSIYHLNICFCTFFLFEYIFICLCSQCIILPSMFLSVFSQCDCFVCVCEWVKQLSDYNNAINMQKPNEHT